MHILLGAGSFEDVLQILQEAKLSLGEILSAVEFMDSDSMGLVKTHLKLTNPIEDFPFYMHIETSGAYICN